MLPTPIQSRLKSQIETDEQTRFEFYLFKLETHRAFIELQGKEIPISDVTIEEYLQWAYDFELTQEDLGVEILYEEVM